MRKIYIITLFSLITFMAFSQTKIILSANGKTLTATLAENTATEELVKLLPLTIEMSPYGGFEVVGQLPKSLPTSNTQITTEAGDIMLYQGNQLVIFYGSNTWSYTRIGKIDEATSPKIKDFLGDGNVTVTLSLESASVEELRKSKNDSLEIFDLKGNRINPSNLVAGIYIINGNKIHVK